MNAMNALKVVFVFNFIAVLVENSGKFRLRVKSTERLSEIKVCLKEALKRDTRHQWRGGGECTFGETVLDSNEGELAFTFRWTGSFTLRLNLNETILSFTDFDANPLNDWKNNSFGETIVFYRISCDKNYFGADCATFCRPRDDTYGHYSCDPTDGRKVCKNGWKAENCDKPKCRQSCNEIHGFCVEPEECRCRSGWKGDNCEQCQEYPGCVHGYCVSPFQCICHRNWGGILCNRDLDYCGTHEPCLNRGQCVNVDPDSYRCQCLKGFSGVNCQTVVDVCATQPCLNGGECLSSDGIQFECKCNKGFEGDKCQLEVNECLSDPCNNGGTCHDLRARFHCQCPQGWTGDTCSEDRDECRESVCVHSNHCRNTNGSYECLCNRGFEGKNCETEVNDCQRVKCLNNGHCLDLLDDFKCQCEPPFTGRLCQHISEDVCREFEAKFWETKDERNCSQICFCSQIGGQSGGQNGVTCSQCLQKSLQKCSLNAMKDKIKVYSKVNDFCDFLYTTFQTQCCSQESNNEFLVEINPKLSEELKHFSKFFQIKEKEKFSKLLYLLISVSVVLFFVTFSFIFFVRRKRSREESEVVINCIQNNLKSNTLSKNRNSPQMSTSFVDKTL